MKLLSEKLFTEEKKQKLNLDEKGRPIFEIEPDPEEVYEEFIKRNWTDGLPIIPPTVKRVERMLKFTDRDPQDIIGKVPPVDGEATVEKIAINAVMAGCAPQYLPVVLTALEAALDPTCGTRTSITTASFSWPLFIINGPVRDQIDLSSSIGLLGPSIRANVTIGRCMTLIFTTLGGLITGVTEGKKQGAICKFGQCFGEFEEASPWEPLHVERGFEQDVSTVTCIAALGAPRHIFTHAWGYPAVEMSIWAYHMARQSKHPAFGSKGANPVLVINPASAKSFSEDGWTKADVKSFIFENSRVNRDELLQRHPGFPEELRRSHRGKTGFVKGKPGVPRWVQAQMMESDSVIANKLVNPCMNKPDDLVIVVAGWEAALGGKALWWPPTNCEGNQPVTKPITRKDGTPVKSIYELHRD